jgi:oxygen-independent coproporphyrinogen-3 oxidase
VAAIYIHIPFCKSRCVYCNFHSQTNFNSLDALVDSIVLELGERRNYIDNQKVETIYFGGGTPSVLSKKHFEGIFDAVFSNFSIAKNPEITIEANPDDLTEKYISMLADCAFNRISIGIQTFDDNKLTVLNRRHSAQQAVDAVNLCKKYGFRNISIDLIYGLPGQTVAEWEQELKCALMLDIQHISVYCLTYEQSTKLFCDLQQGKIVATDAEILNEMYKSLCQTMRENGFEHYEISNFAKPNYQSRHNSSYWNLTHYIGVGASAHSYNGNSRQWNISDNEQYIQAINDGKVFYEKEILTENDKFNEYIMLTLRTSKGIDLQFIDNEFGEQYLHYLLQNVKKFIEQQLLINTGSTLRLTEQGINISNIIISDLMKV